MLLRKVLLASLAALFLAPRAHAQVGEQGRITSRSDVKLAIEGVPGTSGKKLDALAAALSKPLAKVQRCYAEAISEHPDAAGKLSLEVELPREGKLRVRAPGATGSLAPVRGCIDKAFAKLDVAEVPRPAGARVTLELTHSAAGSAAEVRRREASARKVEVRKAPDGSLRAEGASVQGEVSFEVRAAEREAVESAHHLVREALPGLFDCRRRAAKRASPAGEIALALKPRGGVSVLYTSVASERAPGCAASALKRARGSLKTPAEVTVRFAE